MAKLSITVRDYGGAGERSTMQFEGTPITPLNYEDELALMQTLRAAALAMQLGSETKYVVTTVESPQPGDPPVSKFAQRETKWLVRYKDATTGKAAQVEIPCADLSLLDANSNGRADRTLQKVINFVNAFEAYVSGPDGNDAEVVEIVHVGRNL